MHAAASQNHASAAIPAPLAKGKAVHLAHLDYSVLQQCMHCGMCLPTCPTYMETRLERHSPRGRIALMRAIADGRLDVTPVFGDEMYYCLGCLACETACPAGVDYAHMFEEARADVEKAGVLAKPQRDWIRAFTLRFIFVHPYLLKAIGRLMWIYQASGAEWTVRKLGLTRLLPKNLRELEPLSPRICAQFSDEIIGDIETPEAGAKYRVGMLTGCIQDLAYSDVNRDTVDVLLANYCQVFTPGAQHCCGSLHGHNGELAVAREMARRNIDAMEKAAGALETLDAIITNAAGCGSHLKQYARLLADDSAYARKARLWSERLRDIHEWLAIISIEPAPKVEGPDRSKVTYHEACHLCHGQKITKQPRQVLQAIPGVELVELPESTWCCGSAGVYNITQPEMSAKLLERKLDCIEKTKATVVASANPGCCVQLEHGIRQRSLPVRVAHPITLLAEAYRAQRTDSAKDAGRLE